MSFSEKDFQILDTLDRQEISSQRQLSEYSGISLGQVNYILKSLLEKGMVKIGNFRKNPRKIGYVYHLTPKGIEAKSRMAVKFVIYKLEEYKKLRLRLVEQLTLIEKKGFFRIVFVGPLMVKEFVESIIKEDALKLNLVGHCNNLKNLRFFEANSFDVALLFDGNAESVKSIIKDTKISRDKLLPFW